jgi:hypothetical protein
MNPPDQPTLAPTPRTDAAKEQYLTGEIGIYGVLDESRTLERELTRLRADLERFTGHGLLDCHAICDQRDAAVAERDQLRAEVERWRTVAAEMSRQREHNANEASRARAEQAEASAKLWEADALRYANNTEFWQSRAEKAETELANIANAKPHTWGDMSDSFQAWAQNRARHALAAMKGTP